MKKIQNLFLAGLFITSSFLFAQSTSSLVASGTWSATADDYGSVAKLSSDKGKTVSANFEIKPVDEKAQKYTWGSLKGLFGKNNKVVNISGFSKIKVTYSSDAVFEISYLQGSPAIAKPGAYHLTTLNSTNGKEITKVLNIADFKQPTWSGLKQKLNKESCMGINFQPVLPKGGKTKITIKKIEFIK